MLGISWLVQTSPIELFQEGEPGIDAVLRMAAFAHFLSLKEPCKEAGESNKKPSSPSHRLFRYFMAAPPLFAPYFVKGDLKAPPHLLGSAYVSLVKSLGKVDSASVPTTTIPGTST